MAWYDSFLSSDLFKKKEIEETEFNALFQRINVEQFFNNLNNLWYPGELIRKIGGYNKLEILYKDHDIYSAIDKRLAALVTTRMVIEGDDQSLVDFFEEQLRPHELQLKKDFWWTIYNGWGVEQIIYNEDRSGKVDSFQREDFWRFEPQRDLNHAKLIWTDNNEWRNKIVPYGKYVVTTNNGTASNPFGDAMAERLITPWIFKCNGWDLWMDFAKRFANGFMHAKIDDMTKKNEVRKSLEKAGKSSIVVTDKNSELIMIQASRDSSIYTSIEDKTVRAIQKVILGETQTSDMAERGSSGSAGVQNEVRQEKTWADIELVQKALNETVYQIALVNGFNLDNLPVVTLEWDPDFSIEQAARDNALYNMGVRFTPKYYKKTYGLADDEYTIVEPVTASPFGFKARGKTSFLSPDDMKKFLGSVNEHNCRVHMDASTSRKATRQQGEKEDLVSLLMRNGAAPLDPGDLVSAITSSKNQKELDEKLNALFDTRNNAFADLLTEGLYYAAARGAMLGNPETVKDEEE